MTGDNRLKEMAMKLRSLKDAKADLEAALKAVNKDLEQLTKTDLPEEMARLDIDKASLVGIGTLTLTGDIYASIRAANRDMAKEWLEDNGFGDLVTETINASTLKAWAKEQLKKGVELPEEIFTIIPYEFVKIK